MRIYKNFCSFRDHLTTIKKISLLQFKNYERAVYEFTAPITCITGLNGVGKTNLLDAVYYLCYTKSYFSSYQQHNVKHGTDGFRLEGTFAYEEGEEELISCKWKEGKKEIGVNGVAYEKLTDHIGRYAAVMIAPDDMELINDGSEVRRKWVDGILGQTDKTYLESVLQYQQVLQQRNAWLKAYQVHPPENSHVLEFYDIQLVRFGDYIFKKRQAFISEFIPLLNYFYQALSGGKENIAIHYKSDLASHSFAALLKKGLSQDIRLQRTLKGIHKDDFDFGLNNAHVRQFGSQGQKKSYLFALKLAQFKYLQNISGHTPILLLDDIFEKLDEERLMALLHIITQDDFKQVILTDTHEQRVNDLFNGTGMIQNIVLK